MFADLNSGIQYAPTEDALHQFTDPNRPPSAPRVVPYIGQRPPQRHRKKSYNDDPRTVYLLKQLNDVGQLAARDYSGTTDEDRLTLIVTWIEHRTLKGVHPLIREGQRGRRNGGGTFKCTECHKEYATLQKAMAHLFGDWKLSLWRCTMDCPRKYRSLNELRRHQKESHQVLLPREQKKVDKEYATAYPPPAVPKKHDKRPSPPRDYLKHPLPILPSPPITPSASTPISNPMTSQPIPAHSPFPSSPMYLGNDSEGTMAVTVTQGSMGSSPYLSTHRHNMVDIPFSGNSNYGYNTPTTDFAGRNMQMQVYEPPMTGFIEAASPYDQWPSPPFNAYAQHGNIYHQEPVPTPSEYVWDGTSYRHYSPSAGAEVSRRVPRRDSPFEGLILRPRAKLPVTNVSLALLRFANRDFLLDIYLLRTLIELAAFLYTVFLSFRWLSIIPCRSAYSQRNKKHQHQQFNFSNSLLVIGFTLQQVMLLVASTKEPMDDGYTGLGLRFHDEFS